jgi:RNA polymerase sigma-70 factor, ECF subfamily
MSQHDGSPSTPEAAMERGPAPLTPDEFESMTVELSQPLMAAALRLTRRRADAEDLVQETLYRAFRSLASFERGTQFKAWLFRILKNCFINRGKHEAGAPAAIDPTEMDEPAPDAAVADLKDLRELAGMADHHFDERVKAAVDALPDTYRMPMILYALGDLSYQEIADALEVPIGTVMSRLHRARAQLRGELLAYVREHRFPTGEA